MEEKERIQYLANIMKLVMADGVLDAKEEFAYNSICKEINAKKREVTQADKMASEEDFCLLPVKRFSDNIRNVEDMIMVSLADGEIAPQEQKIIVGFAKTIGVTQEQINKILHAIKSKLKNNNSLIKCVNCKVEISEASKFCPECGAAMQSVSEEKQMLEFCYPKTGISIEFAESTSASFHEAKSIAIKAFDYQECMRAKKKWYLATWQRDQILNALKLAQSLKGLRNRKVFLDGKQMNWDEVFGFAWCITHRDEAYKPTEYCFGVDDDRLNLWGCRQINMDWIEWGDWFSYGRFIKKDVFSFDIDRIKHEVSTNLHKVRFCPHLKPMLIQAIIGLLPSKVKVATRSGWQYKRAYNDSPNAIKVVIKQKEDGYTFTDEFYSNGVRPIGLDVAKDILRKAISKCGLNEIKVNNILR